MADTDTSDRRRFDELVVWYVNGTLDDGGRRWVDDYLRRHPEAEHELHWHRELKLAAEMPNFQARPEPGLDKLLQRVRQDARERAPGPLDRFLRFIDGFSVRPVMAAACVLVLVQAIALGFLGTEVRDRQAVIDGYEQTRGVEDSGAAAGRLRVTFRSEATEREIRLLLVRIGGRIVDGPGQLGDYTVDVGAANVPAALAALEGNSIVEQAAASAKSGVSR